jgi:hypothetical protein
MPQSDVKMFFDQASAASQGLVVYRDFESVYGPLFSYFLGGFVLLWRDARVLVLAMIAVEMLAVWVTDLVFRHLPNEKRAQAIFLYALLPAPLVLTVISGQEDVWIWVVAATSFYWLSKRKHFFAGVSLALGFAMTKIVLLLGAAPLLFVAASPVMFLLGCSTLLAGYWLLFQYAGPMVFQPLNEIATLTPPSIWFLINAAGAHISRELAARLGMVSAAVVGFLGLGLAYFRRKRLQNDVETFASLWCFIYLLLMIFSPKTLGAYVMFFQLPLIFVAIRNRDRGALIANTLLSGIVTVEDSHWFRLGLPALTTRPMPPSHLLELGMDLAMLGLMAYLLVRCWVWFRGDYGTSCIEQ